MVAPLEMLERRDCPAVISISGPTDAPENGAPITLAVTISEAQQKPVEVRYVTSGSATPGKDYRLTSGASGLGVPNGTLIIRPGQTTVPITLTPINDSLREGTETFTFGLLTARGHVLGAKSVSGVMLDDDAYTASVGGPTRVAAGTPATFTLQLSSPATKTETFLVSTQDRSASNPGDYTSLTDLRLVLRPGQSSKTFTVGIAANAFAEADETFVIAARSQAAGMPPISPFTVTIAGLGPPVPPAGPPLADTTFTQGYGWGVVNAAAAIGRLRGATTALPEVASIGGVNWGNDMVRAPEAWAAGLTGSGIVVAVVDTGVDYTHPSLRNSIWVNPREVPNDGVDNDNNGFIDDVRGWDFYDVDNDPMDEIGSPNLQGGHGTHVAGTIAAAASTAGPGGVAYNAKIMPIRIFDEVIGAQYLAESIIYAANNGAHIINLSLGGPSDTAVTEAIRFATSLGSIVVIASGNDGRANPGFPASLATLPGVLAVGAVTNTQAVASFSNRAGTSQSLQYVAAPGAQVTSTVPQGYPGATTSTAGTFATFDGTSMATPHVAGVVALLLGAVPNPRAAGVRDRVVQALVSTSQQPSQVGLAAAAAALQAPQPRRAALAFATLRLV